MTNSQHMRPESTAPETEQSELAWWQKFAEFEQRFSWVQTPAVQNVLRGGYIREIIRATPRGGRILELGCGTGWLCRKLVQFGAREVWGIDFSPAQIALANADAAAAGLAGRLHFRCADGTRGNPADDLFDCVLVHAFMHHLDRLEIRRVLDSIPAMLKPDGVFIVFEPVRHGGTRRQPSRWEIGQRRLAELAIRGKKYGVRNMSEEEARWRSLMETRSVGKEPHGPSPKEMPFAPGELEEYLGAHFQITASRPCMALSHLVAEEWLLRAISYPVSNRLLLPFITRIAAWMDGRLLRESEMSAGTWKFTMFVCKPLASGK